MVCALLAVVTPACNALPKQRYSRDGGEPRSLVGVSTNIITSSLLKGAAETSGNHVFSPIGFSSILAMISEGAEGQTLKELYDVFKFPTDRDLGECHTLASLPAHGSPFLSHLLFQFAKRLMFR